MNKTVGFVGLGIMGKPMAMNLMKAGFSLAVFARNPEKIREITRQGAVLAPSPKDVASRSHFMITMLPDSPEVREVVLGPEGIIAGARPGSVLIDTSSISPLATQQIAAELKERGIDMLDAPVSGGEAGAIQSTLAIMVGGEEKVFKKSLEILKAMGKNIVHVGPIGSGGYVKLVNQVIVALNIAALGEAFTLGIKAGLDPRVMYEAIKDGLAGSRVLDAKAPMMAEGQFRPGFKLKLHHKDLTNALLSAKDLGVAMPLSSFVQQVLVSLMAHGKGEQDHGAIVTFFETMSGIAKRD